MSLQVCGQCGTRYALGVDRCPHCSSTDLAPDNVGRVPLVVHVHCPNETCEAHGRQRRLVLQRVVTGVVALPALLCEISGDQVIVRWPGALQEDSSMPKITVHGGPTGAGEPRVVGAGWGESTDDTAAQQGVVTVGETGPEMVAPPAGAAVDAHTLAVGEEGETLGGPFEPLPEAVEGDTTEHVAEPDYDTWTARQLRAVLAGRRLSTSGNREVLIARLRKADGTDPDQAGQ